jgi:hypothetical protein
MNARKKYTQVCPNDGFEMISVTKRFGSKLKCPKCGLRVEKENVREDGDNLFLFTDRLKKSNAMNIDLYYEG